jgi:tetratricopeptide (TPR) repeat protein
MRKTTRAARALGTVCALLLALAGLWACSDTGGGGRVPLEAQTVGGLQLMPALQEELDAGNAAYRARDYAAALTHYEEAVRLDDQLAAGWYGVALAQGALGDSAARGVALAHVERLAPEIPAHHP